MTMEISVESSKTSMIRQVMPEFLSKEHVIILFDSWYTKKNLVAIIDEYPNLDFIGNARIDSVMYDLAPARTGHRGRPAKQGKRLSVLGLAIPGTSTPY